VLGSDSSSASTRTDSSSPEDGLSGGDHQRRGYRFSRKRSNRYELATTLTEEKPIAAPAKIGLSSPSAASGIVDLQIVDSVQGQLAEPDSMRMWRRFRLRGDGSLRRWARAESRGPFLLDLAIPPHGQRSYPSEEEQGDDSRGAMLAVLVGVWVTRAATGALGQPARSA
jgi:hypothetical protein